MTTSPPSVPDSVAPSAAQGEFRTQAVRLVRGNAVLVDDVSVSFRPGEFVSVLGPNGAGKSSLLKLLTREILPTSGTVFWDNRNLGGWAPGDMARRRAVLPQESALNFPFPVQEVVMLGRAPHLRGAESRRDYEIVGHSLELAGISHLATRSYLTLSGGEKHRVHFARVLAQIHVAEEDAGAGGGDAGKDGFAIAPGTFLMLDEPTAALDLYYQHRVLQTARELSRRGAGVITILHDLTLAGRYADRILLMEKGKLVADDTADAVLGSQLIQQVFGVHIHRHSSPDGAAAYVASLPAGAPPRC